MNRRTQALVAAFTSLNESVDRIACFKPLRQAFLSALPEDVRAEDDDALVWSLFQLRKSGKLIAKHREN